MYRTIELLDKFNCADDCKVVDQFCSLIDHMLKDIQQLELECISTRYWLSRYMDDDRGELLRSDIFSNLAGRYHNDPAYQLFTALLYDGGDPMEFREYVLKTQEAANGNGHCWH